MGTVDIVTKEYMRENAIFADVFNYLIYGGKQVVCVCNFEPMRIGDVKSEVRLLGSDTDEGCILLTSLTPVKNGSKIF